MAGETKVFIQAASDSWMGARSNIIAIHVGNLVGATTQIPLMQTSNGLCIPNGTHIQVNNSLEDGLNGNTYRVSSAPGSGSTSYFNGSDFYLRATTGDAATSASNIGFDATYRGAGGEVLWFFADDDPRKMYGLPYHYVAHKGTHQADWTTDDQGARSRKYAIANALSDQLRNQEFRYRTRWDYIAPAQASLGGGLVPGYGFADKSDVFKQGGTIVTSCRAVDPGEGYESIIATNQPHFAEVGDLFTTRDFNSDKLQNLVVDITGSSPDGTNNVSTIPDVDSVFQVYSVLDGLRFTAHKLANQSSKTHLGLNCTTTGAATSGTGRGAKVMFTGKASHADDYFQRPARMPTTTRFQLNVTDISHTFNDLVSITPMMKARWDGKLHEQIQTLGYSVGMRKENMKLSGTLVDRGPISATNIRKQIFINICRTQWLKISGLWGGKREEEGHTSPDFTDFKGIGNAGPVNPRSYPCLTIYDPLDQESPVTLDSTKVDVNPDGGYNIYRGIIKNLSFTQVGGKPGIWDWSMDFVVMSNEKPASGTLDYRVPEDEEED